MDTSLWPNLRLDDSVLRETTQDENQLVLWIRGSLEGVYQNWERISAAAESSGEKGVWRFVHATATLARQKVRNIFGKPIQHLRIASADDGWRLPDGTWAEQVGEPLTDRLLVWSEQIERIAAEMAERDFGSQGIVQRLGGNSFLISPPNENSRSSPPTSEVNPPNVPKKSTDCQKIREQANASLKAARALGDRRQEATALIDLGVVSLREGDVQQSVDLLQEAMGLAAQLYDRDVESDALVNFGLALLAVGQTERAEQILNQEVDQARTCGELYREKIALDHLGAVHVKRGDIKGAIARYEAALALAQKAGDRQHQADLYWVMAIQYAELGDRAQTMSSARQAIEIYEEIKDPNVGELKDSLRRFSGEAFGTGKTDDENLDFGRSVIGYYTGPGSASSGSDSVSESAASGPRLLWMAFSAAKSLAKFVGAGMRTVDTLVYERRLQACATCHQYTGVRCKACGCFTSIKAWLPHEKCPLAKWPD